ncbi:hypothetical protein FH972_014900 [Carpinus fangiana]|uniref:RING-type domain-containing protein n=1 Tax=Carpinus fangiana TaxID=176857 RepID=A0A5N6REB8_9ROSI|nr:hypothetical protein FH972_014900 [Carpinus fangiana]
MGSWNGAIEGYKISYLNSTSVRLSLLDLNLRQDQNMEEMNIDEVVDVPDTPDRLAAHHIIGKECVGRECNSSLTASLRNPDIVDGKCMNGLRGRGRLVNDNGQNRRLIIRSRKNLSNDEPKGCGNSLVLSPSENTNASQNAHLFRRPVKDKSSIHKIRHSIGTENMDKGKGICPKFPSISSGCEEGTAFSDLTEQNGHRQKPKTIFPHDAFKDLLVEDKRKEQILTIDGSSSKASNNAYKGKEKLEDNVSKGPELAVAHGKGANMSNDSQHKTEKQMSKPVQSLTLPRVSGQKRLVRNGCISPHNIATRAKQLAEGQSTSSIAKQSPLGAVVSKSTPCLININDIVSEDNNGDRVKGKGVVIHPSTSKDQGDKIIHTTGRPVINNEDADGSSYAIRNTFGCSEGLGGWRSTRSRSRFTDHPLSDVVVPHSGRIDGVGSFISQQHKNRAEQRDAVSRINRRVHFDFAKESDAAQTASRIDSEVDRVAGSHHAANTLTRRQKKHKLTSRNPGECSTSVSDDSDIVFLGSSGENSRSSRLQTRQNWGGLDPVIEVDELSPEMRQTISRGLDCINIDDSDSRTRQVEADEMLARELQEQLYHEEPVVGAGGTDENLAWALPQEDVLHAASGGSHIESHPRGSLVSHSYRQPRSRPSQNPSIRRGAQARAPTSSRLAQLMRTQSRVPTSSRITQLRNHFSRHSPTVSSNRRNLRFPMDMDLDMRLDILEALEAAVGDISDMSMANHIFQVQRDFNENDYEMLLALDDNNHQHAGASANQINCLPQSAVQTDSSEEACAICLEIPTIGETIRHLPCLHKFHRDCIDPWLSRKASCPVCKSSIT